jgi:hypothetical protein
VEDPESRDTQQHETKHSVEHLKGILIKRRSIMEDKISHNPTHNDDEAVYQEDAPVRQ